MFRLKNYSFVLLALALSSCNLFTNDEGGDSLARVNDVFLNKSDASDLLEKLQGKKDSATIVSNYINNWVEQELLLQKAELNLREDQKNFQKLLEDYRKSLIIYAYQQEWIEQTLDTIVSENEISNYYNENEENFDLKENIVKVKYVIVPSNAPKLEELEEVIRKNDDESKLFFHDYCVQYAFDYNDNDSIWMAFNDVLKNINLPVENGDNFLKNNNFITGADSLYIYMMHIEEYRIKNETSPLDYETEKIKSIIINKRKLGLISEMKENLFKSSLEKGHAEIYEH